MYQNIAEEFEAVDRLRCAVAQLGFARTLRVLAEIVHEEAERLLQAGDRRRAATYARTFQVLSTMIATLPQ